MSSIRDEEVDTSNNADLQNIKKSSTRFKAMRSGSSFVGLKSRGSEPNLQVVDQYGNGKMSKNSRSFLRTQQTTMMKPIKDQETEIDEETYKMFVDNTNNDAISTRKAINERLEKLSANDPQTPRDDWSVTMDPLTMTD